jgi:hypothetical protein
MLVLADRVLEASASTGTGDFALLGATLGYRAFSSVLTSTDCTYYCIENANGEWEVGIGCVVSGPALERIAVLSSSNANALVSFGVGAKRVFIDIPAAAANGNELEVFGDGSDGDVIWTDGVLDLTRNANFNSLTISGRGIVRTNGWELKVSCELDLSNAGQCAILADGGNTVNGNLASAQMNAGRNTNYYSLFLPMGYNGGIGANAGDASANVPENSEQLRSMQYSGMVGGVGGQGGTGVGGSGVCFYNYETRPEFRHYAQLPTRMIAGGGGSGGGGGTASTGGVGGAGGAGGNWLRVCARVVRTSASTAAAALSAMGGNGAAGGNAATGIGGGGGGAGGGGIIDLHYVARIGGTVAGFANVSGGNGGAGGNGSTGQAGGSGGVGGSGGQFIAHHYAGRTVTVQNRTGTAGAAGSAPTGSIGGAGGLGTQAYEDF